MRIKHFSSTNFHGQDYTFSGDLMIERLAKNPADVFVVGGDFKPALVRSIEALAPLAAVSPVVYVPGNLDFYSVEGNQTMEDMLSRAKEAADRIGNIHLLQNESVVIGDTRFIGATLWSRVTNEMRDLIPRHNDFRQIRTSDGLWSAARQNLEHEITSDFIENELSANDGLANVVVTHNSPHPTAIDPRFYGDILNPLFSSDMGYLLEGPFAPEMWVAGSNPVTMEWVIGNTEIVSNGMGHSQNGKPENLKFDFDRYAEVAPRKLSNTIQIPKGRP